MTMWDNDAPTDAPLTRAAPATDHQAETCATCARPAPPGKLRCDLCISVEWEMLKAADPDWYERHRMYRRQTAGGDA